MSNIIEDMVKGQKELIKLATILNEKIESMTYLFEDVAEAIEKVRFSDTAIDKVGSFEQGYGNLDSTGGARNVGMEFGAGQLPCCMGFAGQGVGSSEGAEDEGLGDGELSPVEAQRLRNQEFLDEQQIFKDAQFSMDEEYETKSVNLGKQSWDQKLAVMAGTAQAMGNLMQNLYVATGSKHRALFEGMKAFSIAETIIDTYKAAQLSYTAYAGIPIVGPILGIAAAAAAMASGMARVKAIKNARPGGGGGATSSGGRGAPSYRGGSGNAYPVPRSDEKVKSTQQIVMNIYNPLSEQNWAEIAENNIIPALNDASDRNINLTVKTIAA